MMSINDTIDLVFQATVLAKGGEVFILKMPVVRLGDLIEVVTDQVSRQYNIPKASIKTETTGLRAGEKMYEELMTETEATAAFETDEMLIIPPQIEMPSITFQVTDYLGVRKCRLSRYSSRDVAPLSREKVKGLLYPGS